MAGFGAVLLGAAIAGVAPGSPAAVSACGIACMLLSALYLASPTWRLEVTTDASGFEVRSKHKQRFRVEWSAVHEVITSSATRTCFIDSGTPETSFIVPGEGAYAPYDIEDKHRLYDVVVAAVPADRLRDVALLSTARKEALDNEAAT